MLCCLCLFSGIITGENLKRGLKEFGIALDDSALNSLLQSLDMQNLRSVNYTMFSSWFHSDLRIVVTLEQMMGSLIEVYQSEMRTVESRFRQWFDEADAVPRDQQLYQAEFNVAMEKLDPTKSPSQLNDMFNEALRIEFENQRSAAIAIAHEAGDLTFTPLIAPAISLSFAAFFQVCKRHRLGTASLKPYADFKSFVKRFRKISKIAEQTAAMTMSNEQYQTKLQDEEEKEQLNDKVSPPAVSNPSVIVEDDDEED